MSPSEHAASTVADEVRVALARRRKSQGWLADQIGLHSSTFSRRMSGHTSFTLDELTAISAALGVPLGQLLGVTATQTPGGGVPLPAAAGATTPQAESHA